MNSDEVLIDMRVRVDHPHGPISSGPGRVVFRYAKRPAVVIVRLDSGRKVIAHCSRLQPLVVTS